MTELAKDIKCDRFNNQVFISSTCPTCDLVHSFVVSPNFPDFIGALYRCSCGTEYTMIVQIPHGDTV